MPDTYCLRPTLDRREIRVGVGLQNDATECVFKILYTVAKSQSIRPDSTRPLAHLVARHEPAAALVSSVATGVHFARMFLDRRTLGLRPAKRPSALAISRWVTSARRHPHGRAWACGGRAARPGILSGPHPPRNPFPLGPESFPGRTPCGILSAFSAHHDGNLPPAGRVGSCSARNPFRATSPARSARNPFRAEPPAESFPHSESMTITILHQQVGQARRVPCPRLCVGMRLKMNPELGKAGQSPAKSPRRSRASTCRHPDHSPAPHKPNIKRNRNSPSLRSTRPLRSIPRVLSLV